MLSVVVTKRQCKVAHFVWLQSRVFHPFLCFGQTVALRRGAF